MPSWLSHFLPFLTATGGAKTRSLYDAVSADDPAAVAQWLEKGANPNHVLPELQESALDVAVLNGRVHLIKQLMQGGAKFGPAQVSAALLRHREGVVRFFHAQGVDWSQPAVSWRQITPGAPQSLGEQFHKISPLLAQELKVPAEPLAETEKKTWGRKKRH
jgi:hypothetical protein